MNSFKKHILQVSSFHDLVSVPFKNEINAIAWSRTLPGDYSEIAEKITCEGNMIEVDEQNLNGLDLSLQGKIARETILNDLKLLKDYGASPVLNLIKHYERDEALLFFPTDVYSFHVDRSPVAVDTFLCTYSGAASEILPNELADQKINIPAIRNELKKLFDGPEENFNVFLSENFFDLHYQAKEGARPVNLGTGNLWRLAIDHPESKVPPCLHRAPLESGLPRLLLIC